MNRRVLLLSAVALGLAAACTSDEAPVEPAWGKQSCAHCAMLLGDRRFGAQIVTADGERRFFDDVGCLVVYLEERRGAPARAWVRDADGARWIDARSARYTPGAATPMDFGFEARAASAPQGVSWEEMRARTLAKARPGGAS
jgi:hypothetical protein